MRILSSSLLRFRSFSDVGFRKNLIVFKFVPDIRFFCENNGERLGSGGGATTPPTPRTDRLTDRE
jgi:hypothetical protein